MKEKAENHRDNDDLVMQKFARTHGRNAAS